MRSPSNQIINGILGTTRPVDFALGDKNSRANYSDSRLAARELNENSVATIIYENGYRLWGNRTCASDPKWTFLSVRRTADMINESLLQAHLWAVDRNITKTYVEDVTESVNAYLRRLKSKGAILGGRCWPDPDLNTAMSVADGNICFDFDFTPPYPAEHIVCHTMCVSRTALKIILRRFSKNEPDRISPPAQEHEFVCGRARLCRAPRSEKSRSNYPN